jgi:hypothetical protein
MVNILNNFFVSVFTREDFSSMPEVVQDNSQDMRVTVAKESSKKDQRFLKGFCTSSRWDHVKAPRLLKKPADCLREPLELIFQQFQSSGTIPRERKQATVIPISKKWSKKEA